MVYAVVLPLSLWVFATQEPALAASLAGEAVVVGLVLWRSTRTWPRDAISRQPILGAAGIALAGIAALLAWYLADYGPAADDWGLVLLGMFGLGFALPQLAVMAAVPAAIVGGLARVVVRHLRQEDAGQRALPSRLAFVVFGGLLAPLLAFGAMFNVGMALTG